MLIIPTSLDTAIFLEFRHPLVWAAMAYTSLTVGAYCLWEMIASLLSGRKPPASRWVWLIAAAAMIAAAALSSSLMFGSVTFNVDGPDWVSTSWGVVIGDACLVAFSVCVLVILVLRTADAARVGRSGHPLHPVWRLLGLCMMIAYGLLLALNEDMAHGSALGTTVLVSNFALAVGGIGSLLAAAVIQRMRLVRTGEAQSTSV